MEKKIKEIKKRIKEIIQEYLRKIIKYLKKQIRELNKDKNKYYWKRKYYKLLREVNKEKKRNDTLAVDLRKTYAQKKVYQNLYQRFCLWLDLVVKEGTKNENN